jgi:uncharacterized protein (DUF2252 family)
MACHSVVAGAHDDKGEGEATMCAQKGEAATEEASSVAPPQGQSVPPNPSPSYPALWPRLVGAQSVNIGPEERIRRGKSSRKDTPRSSHAYYEAADDRRDPVGLLEEQSTTREPALVPVRYGRMLVSPFSFFRGASIVFASDLRVTPSTGMTAQLCGDAHMSNFGVFSSPERYLYFDVNEFDQSAPGPFEWDVKRLASSLEVAGRDNGYSGEQRGMVVRSAVRSYREAMSEFSAMSMIDVWYAHLDIDRLLPRFHSLLNAKRTPEAWHAHTEARVQDSHRSLDLLTELVGDEPRIVSDPPVIVPIEELGLDHDSGELKWLHSTIRSYARTLQPELRHLLDQYRLVHIARKVSGVGSVGMDTWILLLLEHAYGSPVFLQVRRAEASVLERFGSKGAFSNHGQRIVWGQRLTQAAEDIFLGWEREVREGQENDYYIRQLPDWQGSADVAGMTPAAMELWGRMCGWTLARGHARSGDRVAIASYLGRSDSFERALVKFAKAYADQNERDYEALRKAVRKGRVAAEAVG